MLGIPKGSSRTFCLLDGICDFTLYKVWVSFTLLPFGFFHHSSHIRSFHLGLLRRAYPEVPTMSLFSRVSLGLPLLLLAVGGQASCNGAKSVLPKYLGGNVGG